MINDARMSPFHCFHLYVALVIEGLNHDEHSFAEMPFQIKVFSHVVVVVVVVC